MSRMGRSERVRRFATLLRVAVVCLAGVRVVGVCLVGVCLAGAGAGAVQSVPPGGFFFIQISDTQLGFASDDQDLAQDSANAELAVAAINRLKPAFVIVTGDLVNKTGDAAQLAAYQRIIDGIDAQIPVHTVAGNHDLGNSPTAATLAAWRQRFGRDYYAFRQGPLYAIVLDSTLIADPSGAPEESRRQDAWLDRELARARKSGAAHVVLFEHHPPFLQAQEELDQYFNLPRTRRDPLLQRLRTAGVKLVVSGHLHRPSDFTDGGIESVVTGAVGRPLGGASGLRIFVVTERAITHRYYALDELPDGIPAE